MEARASLIQHTAAQEHATQRNRTRQRQCKTSPGPIRTPGDRAPVWMGPGLVGNDSGAFTADACKTVASIGLQLAGRAPPRCGLWFDSNLLREPIAIGETHRDDSPQPSTRLRFSILFADTGAQPRNRHKFHCSTSTVDSRKTLAPNRAQEHTGIKILPEK